MQKIIKYIEQLINSELPIIRIEDAKHKLAHMLCAKMIIYSFLGERFTEVNLEKGKICNEYFICDEFDIHDETLKDAMLFTTEILTEILYSGNMDLSNIEARMINYFEHNIHFFLKKEHFENFIHGLLGVVVDVISNESKEISSYAKILLDEKKITGTEYFDGDLVKLYWEAKNENEFEDDKSIADLSFDDLPLDDLPF